MSKILNTSEVNRLAKLGEIESKLSNDYLTDITDKQTELLVNFFYKGEDILQQQRKIELLNLSLAMPSLVCRTIADYAGKARNSLKVETWETIYNITWAGYGVFVYGVVENEPFVQIVDPDRYSVGDNGEEVILTYYKHETSNKTETYVLKRIYENGQITNELWRLDNTAKVSKDGDIQHTLDGVQVSLDTLQDTAHLEGVESTGLSFNPIVIGSIGKGYFGTSIVDEILPLARSLEMNLFNVQDQFFKHLQAKMTVPQSNRPNNPNETFDVRNNEVITVAAGEHTPTYLTNENKMIVHFFEYFETLVRQISSITGIPIDFLGLKSTGGAESASAKTIKLSKFIKRIELSREIFLEMLSKVHEGLSMLLKQEDLEVEFGDIFPSNKLDEAKELEIAKGSSLISDIKAIMRYQDISEEEAVKELALINEQNSDVDLEKLMEVNV